MMIENLRISKFEVGQRVVWAVGPGVTEWNFMSGTITSWWQRDDGAIVYDIDNGRHGIEEDDLVRLAKEADRRFLLMHREHVGSEIELARRKLKQRGDGR